ncbi:acyl-CoA thioesterase [Acidimangrovimonas sediminis]|uniref:acyl-CoA thioesterase n=1 Tax=Acidimangrovimonas sediminis TaxID=2056283 RepID=UPI000C80D65A|nr:acyl-CoA thioesterase [Acidimangrovimonas sediminis]
MYPFARLALELYLARKLAPASPFETLVTHHRCWPWDLDPWRELNNGRTLTLYDLGRIPFFQRTGIVGAMRTNRWGASIAGASVRYRKRIKLMARFEMRTRMLGWDHRFSYVEQSLWLGETCANHILLRVAVTDAQGIVAPAKVGAALGVSGESPALPSWVQAWIAADAERPWPPQG